MTNEEAASYWAGAFSGDVLHITADHARSSMPPLPEKRFIVEPQVLNAALEVEERRPPVLPSPSRTVAVGGLPPPPRPNSRKGKPQRATPASPACGDASLPNSPLSSPYSNSPDTPANSDSGHVRPSPRLSNILGPESLLFNSLQRRSMVEHSALSLFYGDNAKEDESPAVSPWSPREQPEELLLVSPHGSCQSSLPSSPIAATPVDGSRPSRQHRYLSGLQKITKLGKAKPPISMFTDKGVRNSRRMSDAELDPRSSQKKGSRGSEDLSSRYRRMLDKGVKTAGELMKPSSSVPTSPISPPVKNMTVLAGAERHGRWVEDSGTRVGDGREGFSRTGLVAGGTQPPSATRASAVASLGGASEAARGSPVAVAASPRARRSHGRQRSDISSSSFALSSSLSPSESSHEPPSSTTEPRISISSTIYPDSSNSHSFDLPRQTSPRAAMSPDRESFIELASPTLSPHAAEFQLIDIPPTSTFHHPYAEQPMPTATRKSSESQYGKPPSHSSSPSPSSASSKPRLARLVPPSIDKPPLPTAPKPDFSYRSRSANRSSPVQTKKPSPSTSSGAEHDATGPTFSASNALTARERADRIRTTRKLQQVFGQPPGVSAVSQEGQDVLVPSAVCMPMPSPLALNLSVRRKHQHRPAVSMSDDVPNTTPVYYDAAGDVLWPPPEGTRYVTLAARRHSAPLSPDEFSFMGSRRSHDSDRSAGVADVGRASVSEIGTAEGAPDSDRASSVRPRRGRSGAGPGSPTSFIDLSDEEGTADGEPDPVVETPKASRGRSPPFSPSTASLADSLASDYLAEEERRRKREKLAKLHRFLGSRVPPHLVLGPLDEGTPLPPPAPSSLARDEDNDSDDNDDNDDGGDSRKSKMRRRRSSSAAEFSRTWSDDIDRLKEELNEREKAINVRRAMKMEKMFGVAPPQTLYHTRAPVSSSPNISSNVWLPSPSPKSPATPPFRFTTAGPSVKTKGKKRPGTSDSSKPLMDDHRDSGGFLDAGQSSVYMHYRHSLNSLNDIIDRDDRESLAELHDYLTGDHTRTGDQYDYQFGGALASTSNAPGAASPLPNEFAVTTPTTRAERRRSLPSRVSIASFTSEISMAIAPTPTDAAFQQRRRRAAKLTHFFGVDYRDLMEEILESIEKGLEEERGKGTLKPDEVKDLQQKLMSLKTRRNSLPR